MFFTVDTAAECYIFDMFEDITPVNNKDRFGRYLDKLSRLLKQPLCMSTLLNLYYYEISSNRFKNNNLESWLEGLRDDTKPRHLYRQALEIGDDKHPFKSLIIYCMTEYNYIKYNEFKKNST